jgi:hypothetical protein
MQINHCGRLFQEYVADQDETTERKNKVAVVIASGKTPKPTEKKKRKKEEGRGPQSITTNTHTVQKNTGKLLIEVE